MTTVELSQPSPHIAVITLNHPPVNTLSWTSRADLKRILDKLDGDEDIRAVVITGSGRAFTAGAHLGEDQQMDDGALPEFLGDFDRIINGIENFRAPVIGAINGPAIGGGLELALACDIRIASTRAVFVAAGVNVGLMANFWRLARIVGLGPAKEILLTGEKYGAEEALRWGLVSSVHEPDELMAAALAKAERIASRAPLSVEATKRCVNRALDVTQHDADRLQVSEMSALFRSEDHQEALRAFFSKTSGNYQRR
ncbi:enoyl-CoA hydratase/isomerase family protein [Pseudonocardiaceae bacterium YIM PH 21723]|nr:enoyl-CoA hydratase/isomerase family protein [Pseudonocardiaceae bacterium YIM PH 21723]